MKTLDDDMLNHRIKSFWHTSWLDDLVHFLLPTENFLLEKSGLGTIVPCKDGSIAGKMEDYF